MDEKKLSIVYSSSIDKLTEINSSFDKGILRVAYTGKNRNRSFISKDTFEKCIKTIYNVPIVCNYNREIDMIGSHDVEIVKTDNGLKLVNITHPVGVIPESAQYFWQQVEEDNGDVHEYLCVEAIIWKRQEAYEKIKNNKITDESMEITVKSGKTVDGYYHIDSFEFTAFCLLESAPPCYESAGLEMFTLKNFHDEYTEMMSDFKKHFKAVNTSLEGDINYQAKQNLLKGGNISLDRMNLLSEYGLTLESLDFNIEDFTLDELKIKFEELKKKPKEDDDEEPAVPDTEPDTDEGEGAEPNEPDNGENGGEPETGDNTEGGDEGGNGSDTGDTSFSLTAGQLLDGLYDEIYAIKFTDPYLGEMWKYAYVDHDTELCEVYVYDCEDDWKLFGIPYSMNGDHVVVDFACKKRKKFSIVDFVEGSAEFNYKHAFEKYGEVIKLFKDAEFGLVKNDLEAKHSNLEATISELKKFKEERLGAERKEAENFLFEKFAELKGIEAFEQLKSNCSELGLEEIENKCFEIKGRNTALNFTTTKPKSTRLVVETINENEPYGGLFAKYRPNKI